LEKRARDGEIDGRGRTGGSNVASPQPPARHGEPAQVFPANAAPADGRPRMAGVIGYGRHPRRRQRVAGARLQGEGRSAGDAHRPKGGLAGCRTARPRAGRPPRNWARGRPAARSAGPSSPRRRRSNRLRAMGSLPKHSPPMPWPPTATTDGWRDRLESEPCRGKRVRRWATEPQQIPSAGTWA
jgi:hypothetical protein